MAINEDVRDMKEEVNWGSVQELERASATVSSVRRHEMADFVAETFLHSDCTKSPAMKHHFEGKR